MIIIKLEKEQQQQQQQRLDIWVYFEIWDIFTLYYNCDSLRQGFVTTTFDY